jgi:hypothetical protein
VVSCLLLTSAPRLLAQEAPSDQEEPSGVEAAKFRWGPLGVTPRISVTQVGVDTNVLNSAGEPVRDFTATVSPGVENVLRLGRAELTLRTFLNWTYFRESADQRSVGFSEEARVDVLLNRVSPHVSAAYASTRQRPNLEIDARVRQKQRQFRGGSVVRLGSRTSLDLAVNYSEVDFGDEQSGDAQLAHALNRESRVASIFFRMALTPLTTFVVQTTGLQDRFRTSVQRDSNSLLIMPGFEFKPLALISGRAFVGYRLLDVRDKRAPDFSGLAASADVRYVMREMTQFGVALTRDVDYSIGASEPYSVVTGGTVSVTQAIGIDWYVAARAGRTEVRYRSLLEGPAGGAERLERGSAYGAGIGRRLGTDFRVGVDVDYVDRRSDISGRNYDGLRVGGSIAYGI